MRIALPLTFAAIVSSAFAQCSECLLRPEQMVQEWGYPVETHTVTTKDGFSLSMIRIPYGVHNNSNIGKRPPVMIQHGVLDSASSWLVNMPNQALPFILADAGYDVWLGNNRGNKWSPPPCDDASCWNWTFDEFIKYDWPDMVNFVLATTNTSSLSYVAHSQGSLQAFGGLAYNVTMQSKINVFVALAPVTFAKNLGSLMIKAAADLSLDQLVKAFGFKEFLPSDFLTQSAAKLCSTTIAQWLCKNILFQIAGKNPSEGNNLNMSRLELMMWNFPSGTSVKNMAHWGQLVRVDSFGMYDYGQSGNMQQYGQATAPLYDLTKIQTPVATFTGGADVLADALDAEHLESILSSNGNLVLTHKEDTYDHVDFMVGLDAHTKIYPIVLQLLQKYNTN